MADGSKTEKATPKRRRDERKKGNVFKSQDAIAVATLVGSFATFFLLAGRSAERIARFMEFIFSMLAQPIPDIRGVLPEIVKQGLVVVAQVVAPLAGVTILCAVVGTFAQTKMLVTGELLKPKFSRLNPIQGFKRLFSLRSVIEAFKGVLKITLLMVIVYMSLKDLFFESSKFLYTDVNSAASYIFDRASGMIWRVTIAFAALAAADYFYQWWDYERQLKMSKQEIKEEFKQMEGDPKVKGRIRDIQRKMAMSRMMQQVPQADVVIRNPTHFAVALRYDPERDTAPVVLAKGQDELALRIVKVAEESRVAVIENVPLARALYADAELNQIIPEALYGAVAEVLVYIFRLNEDQKLVK